MNNQTNDLKFRAMTADLSQYLANHHADKFTSEYGSLRMKGNHSMSIKMGFPGYHDFGSGDSGNSLDFLIRYLGYDEQTAIAELTSDCPEVYTQIASAISAPAVGELPPQFPEESAGAYRNLFAFLRSRAIPDSTIRTLIEAKLIYQDSHNNVVFINQDRDFAEIRGTNTYADRRCKHRNGCDRYECVCNQWCSHMGTCEQYKKDPYHIIVRHSRKDGFWFFTVGLNPDTCYICEASIDAISLFLIHKRNGTLRPAYYASIGGVSKQAAIDRIKPWTNAIIAVDNDDAGETCRKRNSDLRYIVPVNKDWNEDLIQHKNNP